MSHANAFQSHQPQASVASLIEGLFQIAAEEAALAARMASMPARGGFLPAARVRAFPWRGRRGR